MLERLFRLRENGTTLCAEIVAGMTTFLTMSYIIVVQPAVLSGAMFAQPTGMDFGAVTTATCLAAAAAGAAGAAVPWATELGAVFVSGVLFLLLSLVGAREAVMNSISPSMKRAIAVAIKLALPHLDSALVSNPLYADSALVQRFEIADHVVAAPQAGLMRNDRLPRARHAFVSDAVGTVAGAALGTSTVTSYIESATGAEQGGRSGLTAVVVALLFLVALFFSPVVDMLGGYVPITAPALVLVGGMMLVNVRDLEWDDYTEVVPGILVLLGIPSSYSIADGLALGFISYPLVKVLGGRGRDLRWVSWLLAVLLLGYFVLVRSRL